MRRRHVEVAQQHRRRNIVATLLIRCVDECLRRLATKGDELTLPEKDGDKAFKSSADACQACNFFAHQSKSMKEYCTCYSANTAAFGATSGGFKMETTDQDTSMSH